ncbi:MAG: hypothetical protein FWD97_03245 [Defluviitaleaceae bacterium]|nr:hypothetical protein [Defluviitaleaceae bacterium]
MSALIKFNIAYYINSAKYLIPLLFFGGFLVVNFQTAPIDIWGNLHLTSIAIFVFASMVSATLIASEDKTQLYITLLHTKNETKYHLSKILSAKITLVLFYFITVVFPIIGGHFPRQLTLPEIAVYLIVYFLVGLLGVALGVIFTDRIFPREVAFLGHIIAIVIVAVPLHVVFSDIGFLTYVYYLLPPIHFLADEMHNLGEGTLVMDGNFIIFVVSSIIYSIALTIIYCVATSTRIKR